jgi:hypothetical protein
VMSLVRADDRMMHNQAPEEIGVRRKYTRLLKIRELSAYYVLCGTGRREWNIGDAVDELRVKMKTSRKASLNIIRRFIRIGLLELKDDHVTVKCIGFDEYVRGVVESYLERRMKHGRG